MVKYLEMTEVKSARINDSAQLRLDAYGYTLRGGSPTAYQIQLHRTAHWRRVYVLCFSNCASYFVNVNGEACFIAHMDDISEMANKSKKSA